MTKHTPKPKPLGRALFLRPMDAQTLARITTAARLRNLTLPQYVSRLVALHDAVRRLADAGDERVLAELSALELQTMTVKG